MKKLLVTAVALVLAFSISACSGEKDTTTTEAPTTTVATTTEATTAAEETTTVADATTVAEAGAMYKDGVYTAEQDEFDKSTGWKDNVTITVAGGKITEVVWNGTTNKEGVTEDKLTYSKNGSYGMVKGGAKSEWDVQAEAASAKLVELQDPTLLEVKADGKTDAIAGVSIHVNGFQALAVKALESAKN